MELRAWLERRSLADGLFLCPVPDLWLTDGHVVGTKQSAASEPTKPTQPSNPSAVGMGE